MERRIRLTQISPDRAVLKYILEQIVKSDSAGIKRMLPKAGSSVYLIEGLNSYEANILKQECLSVGADLAISRGAILKNRKEEVTLLFATDKQLARILEKLREQSFEGFSQLMREFDTLANPVIWNIGRKQIVLDKPIIMGILNLTPDSFSGDGVLDVDIALKKAEEMLENGADILDIGAESTRPGAKKVDAKEEKNRLLPFLKQARKRFADAILSVDTYKPEVARAACDVGIDIINDVSGLRCPHMCSVVKEYNVGVVIMHMKGNPRTMQSEPIAGDVIGIVYEALKKRVKKAVSYGIDEDRLVVDPGIGFGKRPKDNYKLLAYTSLFRSIRPVLVGVSRKSLISAVHRSTPDERLAGTIALNLFALSRGASIFRVHDVHEHKQAFLMWQEIGRHLS